MLADVTEWDFHGSSNNFTVTCVRESVTAKTLLVIIKTSHCVQLEVTGG